MVKKENDQDSIIIEVPKLWEQQFPNFNLDAEIPEGFKDTSRQIDGCPSFRNEQIELILLISDKNDDSRYSLQHEAKGDHSKTDLIGTENYDEMLSAIKMVELYSDLGFHVAKTSDGVRFRTVLETGQYIEVHGEFYDDIPLSLTECVTALYYAKNGECEATVTAFDTDDLLREIQGDLVLFVPGYVVEVDGEGKVFHVSGDDFELSYLKGFDGKIVKDFEKPCVIEIHSYNPDIADRKFEHLNVYEVLLDMHRKQFEAQWNEYSELGIYPENVIGFEDDFSGQFIINPFVDSTGRFDLNDPIAEYGQALKDFLRVTPVESLELSPVSKTISDAVCEKIFNEAKDMRLFTDIGNLDFRLKEDWNIFKKGDSEVVVWEWIAEHHSRGMDWMMEQQEKEHPGCFTIKENSKELTFSEMELERRMIIDNFDPVAKKLRAISPAAEYAGYVKDHISVLYAEMEIVVDVKIAKAMLGQGYKASEVQKAISEGSEMAGNRTDTKREYGKMVVKQAAKDLKRDGANNDKGR